MYNNPYCKPFCCSICGYPLNYTNQILCHHNLEEREKFYCECPYYLNTINIHPEQYEYITEDTTSLYDTDKSNRFGGQNNPFQQSYQQQFPSQFPSQFPPFQPTPPIPQQPGGASQFGAPTSPPPSITPKESPQLKAVDPGTISGCLFRYTYVWPVMGLPYWFYPTRIARRSISGYRWNGFMWVYYGTDLNSIRSFTCY